MSSNSGSTASNPFADPAVALLVTERDVIAESTIAVGENGSLSLGSDAILVLDAGMREQPRQFCGINLPSRSTSTKTIPYFNILSASVKDEHITIRYATSKSSSKKAPLVVCALEYQLNSASDLVDRWVAHLLSRAYGPAQRKKKLKVLINPFGGQGYAGQLYRWHAAPIFEAAGCIVDTETTTYRGHAIEIAEKLDITAYDAIVCASGDGLPFEAFNGLGRKANAAEALRKVAIAQLPCGSGNAMSWNLTGTDDCSRAALSIVKGVRTPLDLASVTQGSTRTLSFLSQSIGIVAESDLGTDKLRWMGDFRFTFGFLVRLLGKTQYPVDISVKTEIEDPNEIKRHYAREMQRRQKIDMGSHDILDKELEATAALGLPPLKYGTVSDPLPTDMGWGPMVPYLNLGNFYCGNMCYMTANAPFFPASVPTDGMLDLVTIDGDIGMWKAVKLLVDVEKGTFVNIPDVRYRKVTAIRVVPKFGWTGAQSDPATEKPGFFSSLVHRMNGGGDEGFFSVDGEKLPFGPFQIEIQRGLGTVLSQQWGVYEFEQGPAGWQDIASTESEATA